MNAHPRHERIETVSTLVLSRDAVTNDMGTLDRIRMLKECHDVLRLHCLWNLTHEELCQGRIHY